MAVRSKSRRKIAFGGKKYVWYVLAGDYWETPLLRVISEDKALVLSVPLNAPKPYVVSEGRVFQGKPTSGCWERYFLPFALPEAITPKVVSEIIEWAECGEKAVKTEYGEVARF